MSTSRSVVKKVLSVETEEVWHGSRLSVRRYSGTDSRCLQGAGAVVRRSIGTPQLRNLTPFLMLDHFHISKGAVSVHQVPHQW